MPPHRDAKTQLLADSSLAPFFEGLSMDLLKSHQVRTVLGCVVLISATSIPSQVSFMKILFDDTPNAYKRFNLEAMAIAHSTLIDEKGLNATHYDTFVQLLKESLLSQGIDAELVSEAMQEVKPLRAAFTRGTQAPV